MFDVGGETFEVRIGRGALRQAQRVYQRVYQQAVSDGAMTRRQVLDAVDRLWTTDNHTLYSSLLDAIRADEVLIQGGQLSLTDSLAVAVRLREARAELRELRAEVDAVEQACAEAKALEAKFNYLVACCTFRNGARVFDSAAALEQGGPVVEKARWVMGGILFGLREDYEQALPESLLLAPHASPAQAA